MAEKKRTVSVPVLPLRGVAVFPGMLVHVEVGRDAGAQTLEHCMATGEQIFLAVQRENTVEEPGLGELWTVGTFAWVRQVLRPGGEQARALVEGTARGRLTGLSTGGPCLFGQVEALSQAGRAKLTARAEAAVRRSCELLQAYARLLPGTAPDLLAQAVSSRDPGHIADYIAQNLAMREEDRISLLQEVRPLRRLEHLCRILLRETEVLTLEQQLREKVRQGLAAEEREYILREKLHVLQRELGEGPGEEDEEDRDYQRRILALKAPDEVKEKLLKQARRLHTQPFGSPEGAVVRGYLDTCLELPWGKKTRERLNVAAARKILDADHYGLSKVKERILEFLAVKQLSPELKGQVLCLVGPPGVGKTSVAMSVAKALNRKLGRVALGGIHDEAEIRGHRKTYVGAMPGRIITAVSQTGACNPLLLLDEIDKLGTDQRGDPASALLEVLDGEQNSTFRDHYLELPFDLSDVLFITTANTTDTIPRPLLDRMELIELTSYTDEEKLQIAKRHLLTKERRRHGLSAAQIRLPDDAIRELIAGYTRESGVRVLERELAALCRKAAMAIAEERVKSYTITANDLPKLLGPRKFHPERREQGERVGIVNGLAWTGVGGEVLEVEALAVPGSGKLELTGNLGDVMKESARAALSYIRSRADRLGVEREFYKTRDIHLHFPEGAVPKDGPSAGLAITVAMVSALTGAPVRQDIAMTGEVTLRGRVLPIGGLKEKTMAALRSGIKTVLLPRENEGELEEIDQSVRRALKLVLIGQVDDAIAKAVRRPALQPAEREEE